MILNKGIGKRGVRKIEWEKRNDGVADDSEQQNKNDWKVCI
jgi:hypothetical protein